MQRAQPELNDIAERPDQLAKVGDGHLGHAQMYEECERRAVCCRLQTGVLNSLACAEHTRKLPLFAVAGAKMLR